VKSIIPGGPAAKEGHTLQGEGWRLLGVLLSWVLKGSPRPYPVLS
jgi:hypothetical protein